MLVLAQAAMFRVLCAKSAVRMVATRLVSSLQLSRVNPTSPSAQLHIESVHMINLPD